MYDKLAKMMNLPEDLPDEQINQAVTALAQHCLLCNVQVQLSDWLSWSAASRGAFITTAMSIRGIEPENAVAIPPEASVGPERVALNAMNDKLLEKMNNEATERAVAKLNNVGA